MNFWVLAASLVVIALSYVLPPLLQRTEEAMDERERANVSIYRDQFDELERDLRDGVLDKEQYEQGRLELQRRLLEDVAATTPASGTATTAKSSAREGRTTAILLGSAIPVAALFLYFQIGTPQALNSTVRQAQPSAQGEEAAASPLAPSGQPGAPTQQEIEGRVAKLAERLKENPNDTQGWLMLARSLRSFNRYREASEAYAQAAALAGNDADVWADYAETLALANDSNLQGQPLELVKRALQLNPSHQKALWLAGNAAVQAEDFRRAVSYWEQLLKLLPEGSEAAQSVAASIEDARARMK